MQYLEQTMKNPVGVVMSFILVLFLVKDIYNLYKWYKDRVDDHYSTKTEDEEFHKQVNEINHISEEHTKALKEISESLIKINDRLDNMDESNKEAQRKADKERMIDTVINGRATLYYLYEVLKDKPSLTMSEYETFKNLSDRYLEAGGNGAFKNKIIPDIVSKSIED